MEQVNMDYQYGADNRAEIIPFLPDGSRRILEIGCAYGNFRENITICDEYWGIEPNLFASKIAAKNLDRVLAGDFDTVYSQLPDKYFDLVICNDVIEHMVDHNYFLQKIKNKMSDDSCIIGCIPNVRHIRNLFNLLIKKDWKYMTYGILDYTHLRFFTKKSITEVFNDNSYNIQRLEGVNKELFKWSLKYFLKFPFFFILGMDLRFTQFAFRIKPCN
jgi:SAM-dependent methyltransferase